MKRKYRKSKTSQVVSARVSNEVAEKFKNKAKEKGVGYTVLLQSFILQYLESN